MNEIQGPLRTCIALTPFERPNIGLLRALRTTSALAVLALGRDRQLGEQALAAVAADRKAFGVAITEETADLPLPSSVAVVVVERPRVLDALRAPGRAILSTVCSADEISAAIELGADGLIIKGHEAGGRVGDESTFVLLQRALAMTSLPIWAHGGIGLRGAAAVLAAGARGYVLDTQLALLRESETEQAVQRALQRMDGSETKLVGERRVLVQPGSDSPELPVGQDGALARSLFERYETVAALIRGFERAARGGLRLARRTAPFHPSSSFARSYGLRYPVVQGPMTRVSDTPAFARAVSDAGGLPFIALSLLRGKEASDLIEQTAAKLAGRSWGVGILGFVPEEIRDEQLRLIRAQKPPVVLIAGGTPAQADELERAGIDAYLHVPSPGLLELFLQQGARKFVFEGRECGGHVGPRTSSVLWESALDILLAHDRPQELSVLFAGGIHDARSGAMAAVFAAPLVARGAKAAMLMGTAYLFTREAVESGAIVAGFQQAAVECTSTVLLETGPGHATRAVANDYVHHFDGVRQQLQRDGRSPREMWGALETLNLGRLRVATKGIGRQGESRVACSIAEQQREGLFMIGQVAALRSQITTMERLHTEVSVLATRWLEERVQLTEPTSQSSARIAIVGMACLFPGAEDLDAFFRNVLRNADCITEVPAERWSVDTYFDADGRADSTPSRWGGFLPEQSLSPSELGIPPRSLGTIDPAQLLTLLVAKRALLDAGLTAAALDGERTSVIFGADAGSDLPAAYTLRAFHHQLFGELPSELDALLPAFSEDSFPGVLSNIIAGRVTNRLDLGGVNYVVQAACASSLAALDAACKELAFGSSDVVIAGAADTHNSLVDYLMFASVRALSATGRCRTFDASADGIVLGEGVAALVLKRLDDAHRDGDRIYAVIDAVAGSSDGRNLGLTAPRQQGQELALSRAYERAGLAPSELGLVEAHGTGTVVGDRTELASLTEFFETSGALPASCTLGSVKSQIGHTKCAAGLAGVIKLALSLYHGVLPPTRGIRSPNPYYDASRSPFVFRSASAPWLAPVRHAGVSAFGFGGTNFHVVLSNGGSAPKRIRAWPSELFVLRAPTRDQALARARELSRYAVEHAPYTLAELAANVARVWRNDVVQIAIVAESIADLSSKLSSLSDAARPGNGTYFTPEGWQGGKVAFLFPGQGSQRAGMLSELFVHFPVMRARLEQHPDLVREINPGDAYGAHAEAAQRKHLADTRVAQPALGLVEMALAELLGELGLRADIAAGHSYGELSALCYAGALPHEALRDLSSARAEAMLAAVGDDPGTMSVVLASASDTERAIRAIDGVVVANMNAPSQTLISGATRGIELAEQALAQAGLQTRRIPVAAAFHSPLLRGADVRLGKSLAAIPIRAPRIPVWSNVSARPHADDPDAVRQLVCEQVIAPVRFEPMIRDMYASGARTFIEVGPGNVLTGLVSSILEDRPSCAVAIDRSGVNGVDALLHALAAVAVRGVDFDVDVLFAGRVERELAIGVDQPPALAATDWLIDGHRARPVQGEPPPTAFKPLTKRLSSPLFSAGNAENNGDRDAAVLQYLRTVGELVEGQRQIMLRYLGADPADVACRPVEPHEHAASQLLAPETIAASEAVASTMDPMELLVQILSERTGYPPEMLGSDLDLEADLGIDSIKRTEIVGLLGQRLGFTRAPLTGGLLEQLTKQRTLAQIGRWLEANVQSTSSVATAALPLAAEPVAAPVTNGSSHEPSDSEHKPLERLVVELQLTEATAPADVTPLTAKRIAITNGSLTVAKELAAELERHGAMPLTVRDVSGLDESIDGLVYLEALDPSCSDPAKGLLVAGRHALERGAKTLIAVTALGGRLGFDTDDARIGAGGVAGLLKSIARERTRICARCVDVDPNAAAIDIAMLLAAELTQTGESPEVGYHGGRRQRLQLVQKERPTECVLDLDASSVLLVTGGGRGITAELAYALASRIGLRLELVGTTPLATLVEAPELAACPDMAALRKAMLAIHGKSVGPAEIDRYCRTALAQRELAATLRRVEAAGSSVRYHKADVRDEEAIERVIADIYVQHGRLDGVIHGAGILEDKLLEDKSSESFARVYDTKVSGARALLSRLRGDTRFVAFCSSVSSVFGNRGQTDYAAANDYLDKLALQLNGKNGRRILSINWGPWSGVGMVSDALERSYRRRGVGLIAPAQGAAEFVHELLYGRESQVVLMASASQEAHD